MKIAVDIELYRRNRAGEGRYIEGLLPALMQAGPDDRYTLFRSRTHEDEERVPGLPRERVTEKILPMSHRMRQLRWVVLGSSAVERYVGEHDLYFSPGIPAFPTRGKLVVVVYDLAWMKFPHFYPRYYLWMARTGFRRAVRRCAGILTVSESSRRDILEATGFEDRRVRVAYCGLNDRFATVPSEAEIPEVLARLKVSRPYVLAVAGDHGPKKNLENILRAMATLPPELRAVRLVNVGVPRYNVEGVRALIAELGLSDRVLNVGRVSDVDLRSLYAGARLTAYPSLYEGFGFPILESMALGTPVVTSNVSSMPEVSGDAALLVDPHNVGELSAAIRSILSDDRLRERLREEGLVQAARFTWQNAARNVRDFFAELTGKA